jgi:hypothetical protein
MICLIPELPDPIARRRDHGEAGALRTGRTQLGAGRVDFDPGAVLIVLMGEPTARIGREPRPRTAHELCEHFGNMLGIARGDRQVMDHGIFVPLDNARRLFSPSALAIAIAATDSADVRHLPRLHRGPDCMPIDERLPAAPLLP